MDCPPVAPNVLHHQFSAKGPNQKWSGHITYVYLTDGGFVYLAVVIDLYSRRVIGWSVADTLHTSPVLEVQLRALR